MSNLTPWTHDFSFKQPLDKVCSVPLDKTPFGKVCILTGNTRLEWGYTKNYDFVIIQYKKLSNYLLLFVEFCHR